MVSRRVLKRAYGHVQEHARAVAELRHVEEVLQDTTRQLRAAEGEEEALRAKVGHMRHEADVAQAACDRARSAEAAALQVLPLL